MPAYNFQKQFAPLVESGQKRQTIRAIGKRRHARPGESLRLYTGQRTKACRKLLSPDPECVSVPDSCPDCGLNHKLKSCPYCGSAHCLLLDFMHPDGGVRYYATCEVCHASGPESEQREKAVEQWNSLPRKLRWTTKPPSQEGWYFLREAWASGKWRSHGLVYVYWDEETEALQIRGWGRSVDGVANWGHPQQKRKPEWAGPIPLPVE